MILQHKNSTFAIRTKQLLGIFLSETVSKLNTELDQSFLVPTNAPESQSRKLKISSSRRTPPRHNLHRRSTRCHHHSRLLHPPDPEQLHLRGLQEGESRG